MQPITLRLPEEEADALAEEAEELGFSSRSEYVRHVLRNRSGTDPITDSYPDGHRTEYAQAVDELRERVDALETALSGATPAESPDSSSHVDATPRVNTRRTGLRDDETTLQDAMLDGSLGERVAAAVEDVADEWQDSDARLAERITAAHAVLSHAVETGEAVGKGDAIEEFHGEHAVDGQTDETWWRKNVRPVLKEYGEYSQGAHGYVVEEHDLPDVST